MAPTTALASRKASRDPRGNQAPPEHPATSTVVAVLALLDKEPAHLTAVVAAIATAAHAYGLDRRPDIALTTMFGEAFQARASARDRSPPTTPKAPTASKRPPSTPEGPGGALRPALKDARLSPSSPGATSEPGASSPTLGPMETTDGSPALASAPTADNPPLEDAKEQSMADAFLGAGAAAVRTLAGVLGGAAPASPTPAAAPAFPTPAAAPAFPVPAAAPAFPTPAAAPAFPTPAVASYAAVAAGRSAVKAPGGAKTAARVEPTVAKAAPKDAKAASRDAAVVPKDAAVVPAAPRAEPAAPTAPRAEAATEPRPAEATRPDAPWTIAGPPRAERSPRHKASGQPLHATASANYPAGKPPSFRIHIPSHQVSVEVVVGSARSIANGRGVSVQVRDVGGSPNAPPTATFRSVGTTTVDGTHYFLYELSNRATCREVRLTCGINHLLRGEVRGTRHSVAELLRC